MSAFVLAFVLLAQAPEAPVDTMEIPFRTVAFGSNGKIKDGGAIVLRSAKAFDAYRMQMGTTDSKKPTVDWSKEQLVAIHAAGVGYGGASLQVAKVRKRLGGGLEVEASLDPGSQPPVSTPGVVQVLRKEGIYALIVVGTTKGDVTLKVIEPPRDRGDKPGMSALR